MTDATSTAVSIDPSAALPITVTRFDAVDRPTQWTDAQTTWGEYVARLQADGIVAYLAKEHAPLHAFYRLRRGGRRCDADVERVYAICLDFDATAVEHVLSTVERLQADGIAVLWHTTWSHGQALDPSIKKHAKKIDQLDGARIDQCRRLIIPLATPIQASSYDACLSTIWGRYAEHADRESGGVHRAFYVPSRHPEREGELEYLPGAGLRFADIVAPLAPVPRNTPSGAPSGTPGGTEPHTHEIDHDVWRRLASRWSRHPSPSTVDLGARLGHVLEGVAYADHGERDTITWRLVQAIAHAYPDIAPESVERLFELSIDRMKLDGSTLTLVELREKLERARRAELAARDLSLPDDRRDAIRQAFGDTRDTPYTDEELDGIATRVGLSRDELAHSWILQFDSEYWLVGADGKLAHASRDSLENTARVVLAPAPIDLHEIGKEGRQWMRRRTLLERYSLPLAELSRSLTISEPVFDLPRRRLTMPACPRRAIVPAYSAEIDRWLALLAGDWYPQLVQWLQWVPDLTRPLAALVLTGPKSTGKSLLAQGVSRIWTDTGPTDLICAMGAHNFVLERCPYCFADEGRIPKDWQGRERTDDLREFVQATNRQINQKFRQQVQLDGATRTQIAANNLDVLTLGGNLSGNDVDAIAARFLHIPCSGSAALYLEQMGGRDGVQRWVEGDGIAAHVLWLREKQLYPWSGRFGVEVQPGLVDRLLVRGGIRAQICELVVKTLRDDQPITPARGACCAGGAFACRLDWIGESWETFLRRVKWPGTTAVIQALDGLGVQHDLDGEGWFALDTDRLIAWARESGVGTAERIREWISKHEGNT